MRLGLIALAVFALSAPASAQLVAAPDANPVGIWRGTSRCVAQPSSCAKEVVVFLIAQKGANDSLSVHARKVVDGREEDAASMACQLNAARAYITCTIPDGKWRFTVRHDSLVGQLRLRDGTWIRDVHATRSDEETRYRPGPP